MANAGPPKSRDSFLPLFTVLVTAVVLVVGVVALAGWAGIFVMLAIAAVPAFALMHYLLWGWWLSKRLSEPTEERDGQDHD